MNQSIAVFSEQKINLIHASAFLLFSPDPVSESSFCTLRYALSAFYPIDEAETGKRLELVSEFLEAAMNKLNAWIVMEI